MELTAAVLPRVKRKYIKKKKKAKPIQKLFARNYIKTMGNKALAYRMTHPGCSDMTSKVNGCKALDNPIIANEIEKLLKAQGLPKDYFVRKMKDLAEAKDKDGNPDNRVQFDVMKLGFEFYGLSKKQEEKTQVQINYNLDADKLGGVLTKLAEVTRKLELNGINKGLVQDAEIVEGSTASEEDTGS